MADLFYTAAPTAADFLARRGGSGISVSGSIGGLLGLALLLVVIVGAKQAWKHRDRLSSYYSQPPGTQAQHNPAHHHPAHNHPAQHNPAYNHPAHNHPLQHQGGGVPPGFPPAGVSAAPGAPAPGMPLNAPGPVAGVPLSDTAIRDTATRDIATRDIGMARDPQTPRHILVDMATSAPHLRQHLLENPGLEPGLRQWLLDGAPGGQ